jgi:hypothetical protein
MKTEKRPRGWKVFPVFVVLAGLLSVSYVVPVTFGKSGEYRRRMSEMKQSQPADLEFSFTKCKESSPEFAPRVTGAVWPDDTTFSCEVEISSYCGDDFWSGDYAVEPENTLLLKYTTLKSPGIRPVFAG